jgi:hypothetical protein
MLRQERWELSAEQGACVAELVSITFITRAVSLFLRIAERLRTVDTLVGCF